MLASGKPALTVGPAEFHFVAVGVEKKVVQILMLVSTKAAVLCHWGPLRPLTFTLNRSRWFVHSLVPLLYRLFVASYLFPRVAEIAQLSTAFRAAGFFPLGAACITPREAAAMAITAVLAHIIVSLATVLALAVFFCFAGPSAALAISNPVTPGWMRVCVCAVAACIIGIPVRVGGAYMHTSEQVFV